jgi:hypothetical protein
VLIKIKKIMNNYTKEFHPEHSADMLIQLGWNLHLRALLFTLFIRDILTEKFL